MEGFNPGGSVKDHAALSIVREALRTGALAPGKTVLDATSGNTGIAYAMLGAALGFPVRLMLPADASQERVQILRAYGAQLTLTDSAIGTDGARRLARELARQEGLFVGISAEVAVVAALRVARELASGVVVALLPDGGFKYASAPFWAEQNSHCPHVRQSQGTPVVAGSNKCLTFL